MKYRNLKKKVSAILLATVMTITAFPQMGKEVYAMEQPSVSQFATKEQLLNSFDTDDTTSDKLGQKVYFGQNGFGSWQEWWIAGSQNDDSIVLFAASSLTSDWFSESIRDRTYSDTGQTVYANHYGASDLFSKLKELETNTAYFSAAEQDLMMSTTVWTYDLKNDKNYSTTEKLYAAYGDCDDKYITVGENSSSNLNEGLRIDNSYWVSDTFWLRASHSDLHALMGRRGDYVAFDTVYYSYSVVPAFKLNLSSVLFGSTAPIQAEGKLTPNDGFILRYSSDKLGSAIVTYDKSEVEFENVPSGTYLVVQNSDGAYAKAVNGSASVSASDMQIDSFENCKVWLEKFDDLDRMTYATLATEEQGHTVNVTLSDKMDVTSGSLTQKIGENKPMKNIVIEANDGYMFPADYTVAEQNGITITRDNENQITISGTPTADVNLTLSPVTKKVYSMILTGNGTFTTVCEGYYSVEANEITITNKGNANLNNVNISVTGKDADKFDMEWDTSTIKPSETLKVMVKPKDDLGADTYQATLSVSADNVAAQTIDLQFIVNEHEYEWVTTPPTCTEKGYTIYTCKNCNYSYIGDETDATGHNWGEWEIIQSPTCEQSGSKKHTCKDCQLTETENLNPNGHDWKDDYTVEKEATCTEEGSRSIYCKNCAAVKDSEVIPRLGHSFTNYVSNNDATCTHDGTKTAKCDRCAETHTVVDSNTMLEHEYEWVTTPPTCTEKGYTIYTCKNCNYSYTGDETDATGHNWGEWEIIQSPTCEQSGSKKHTCKDCQLTETENLNPNGHDWKDDYTVEKEATCTEEGSRSIYCKNCAAVKDSEVIPRLGHSFTNYVSNNDATCTHDGTKTAKCDRCNETHTVVDSNTMLEHEYEWVYDNNAECEKNGTETGTCKHCQATVTKTVENSALGHQFGEWKVIREATTTTTGEKERTCERCDTRETEAIPVIFNEDKNNSNKPNASTDEDINNLNKPNTSTDKDKNKSDTEKDSPETGDNANLSLYISLLAMSGLLIAILAVLRKKKMFVNK